MVFGGVFNTVLVITQPVQTHRHNLYFSLHFLLLAILVTMVSERYHDMGNGSYQPPGAP